MGKRIGQASLSHQENMIDYPLLTFWLTVIIPALLIVLVPLWLLYLHGLKVHQGYKCMIGSTFVFLIFMIGLLIFYLMITWTGKTLGDARACLVTDISDNLVTFILYNSTNLESYFFTFDITLKHYWVHELFNCYWYADYTPLTGVQSTYVPSPVVRPDTWAEMVSTIYLLLGIILIVLESVGLVYLFKKFEKLELQDEIHQPFVTNVQGLTW